MKNAALKNEINWKSIESQCSPILENYNGNKSGDSFKTVSFKSLKLEDLNKKTEKRQSENSESNFLLKKKEKKVNSKELANEIIDNLHKRMESFSNSYKNISKKIDDLMIEVTPKNGLKLQKYESKKQKSENSRYSSETSEKLQF